MPLDHPTKSAIATTAAPSAIGPYSQAVHIGNVLYTSARSRSTLPPAPWSRAASKPKPSASSKT